MSTIPDAKVAEAATWRLTHHAKRALKERGFSVLEVLAAVVDPEVEYSGEDYRRGQMVRKRGDCTVIVDPFNRVVVTVLLRAYVRWTDEDARTR